ncbi:hypothetical protein BN2475_380035 [Paraburkholderia ribeironis]|uniref:Uncharacterized protein n=1 Tax=Paraburkholderia ribeironis TaxID=1247936 RepID=A0A1N7S5M2_9BURK|nr:hypothetical protein BN2475_380035 [Paraburkholderia ribeironis]
MWRKRARCAVICALQNRDTRLGAQLHMQRQMGPERPISSGSFTGFSHPGRLGEIRRYNH